MKKENYFGWTILGFIFPIIGLIVLILTINKDRKIAKYIAAGFLLNIVLAIVAVIVFIIFFNVNMKTQEKICQ